MCTDTYIQKHSSVYYVSIIIYIVQYKRAWYISPLALSTVYTNADTDTSELRRPTHRLQQSSLLQSTALPNIILQFTRKDIARRASRTQVIMKASDFFCKNMKLCTITNFITALDQLKDSIQ